MQSEIERIVDQINKVYSNNWAVVDIDGLLRDVDDALANKKLPLFTNTIHQIARHIIATEHLVIKRLQGIDYQLGKEEDWVSSEQLEETLWADTLKTLFDSKEQLVRELRKKTEEDLDRPIIENSSTTYQTIHGHIQHSYYHFGQIMIIKKFIETVADDD